MIYLFRRKNWTFKVPIEKEVTRIDKNGEEIAKKYILHSTIYWQCKIYGKLIINLTNNLSEGIYKTKCKYGHDDKYQTCRINYNCSLQLLCLMHKL